MPGGGTSIRRANRNNNTSEYESLGGFHEQMHSEEPRVKHIWLNCFQSHPRLWLTLDSPTKSLAYLDSQEIRSCAKPAGLQARTDFGLYSSVITPASLPTLKSYYFSEIPCSEKVLMPRLRTTSPERYFHEYNVDPSIRRGRGGEGAELGGQG